MDVNAKIGIDSKRTTAASVAIVGVVVYLPPRSPRRF
ncbi:MAG: hypothetical protein CM15mP78_07040 [Candidatus Poseidoniales archaeon]|nr:MAG: hypothetical protein CM15mP78_07040 [Candidatus Poseidoniales archaeon]